MTAWSTWQYRDSQGRMRTARARRRPRGGWAWTGMPSAWEGPRYIRDRLNAVSHNLGYGSMPPMEVEATSADARLDVGLFLAAWHPGLLIGQEVTAALNLDGTVIPVPTRIAVHPSLPTRHPEPTS